MAPRPRLDLYATLAPLLPLAECGVPGRFEAICATYASQGYAGLEVQVSQVLCIGKARFIAGLKAHGLTFMGKVYSSGGAAAVPALCGAAGDVPHPAPGPSVGEHCAVWAASVRECCTPPELRALLVSISSQGGRDAFHRNGGAEADEFLTRALDLGDELGVLVAHETHRHRVLFSPFLAVDACRRHPRLRLLADLSHYCVVCEAPCDEPELDAAVRELLPRARHVHARVGFEEGPQVLDPRLPAAAAQLAGHARWWRAVFLSARARRDAAVTVTPEALPPPYAWTGADGCALVDAGEVNGWMAAYVRRLWDETMAEVEAQEGRGSSAWAAAHPISAAACVADASELRALLGSSPPPTSEALDALDSEGRAALHYAASNGLPEPIAALLRAGASVDVRSGDRRSTPLHLACGMCHADAVLALLRGGAALDARDVDAWTPLDLAKQDLFGKPAAVDAVVRLLTEHATGSGRGGTTDSLE